MDSIELLQQLDVGGRQLSAVFHDAGTKRIVIFCHGFRGNKTGPSRFFVRLARLLHERGVCSLRFDQYGSGDSAGDFIESSFNHWVTTTTALADRYLQDGYHVALLGQSMGGATVLVAAADLGSRLASVVTWVPGTAVDDVVPDGPWHEEGGQRVQWSYWQEAHAANVARRFREIAAPALVFVATNDHYVSAENQHALIDARQPHQRIEILSGWTHSDWSFDQATQVIYESADFVCTHFSSRGHTPD